METLQNLAFGFEHALTLHNLMYCAIGCSVGTLVGLLPGLGPLATISLLLPLFTAAILGGVGSVPGAVLAAFLISLAENLAALVMPGAYKPLVPFVLLIVVLYVRPQGLFPVAGQR
jgi:branched-subunit amino acid ABC-type transport system permease component